METVKEILLVYGRIITILPLLLVVTLFMGKRSIGELPVFDFLVILTLGSVVGADIADPEIEHIHTAMAIIGLALLQRVISEMIIRYRKVGKALTFEPTIVIMNGVFIVGNLRKIHYSIDNLLQMLREKDIFDISDVHLGIIEPNGKLSLFKKPEKSSVTCEDFNIKKGMNHLTYPVIIEGKIDASTLNHFNVNESWLMEQLKRKGIQQIDEVFFASLNEELTFHVSLRNETMPDMIKH